MLTITICTGKLHRVVVTGAQLNYVGSITIGPELMEAAGIVAGQLLYINGLETGHHWETYAVKGKKGEICLNGPPARLFQPGDRVIIVAWAQCTIDEAAKVKYRAVYVDEKNNITKIDIQNAKDLSGHKETKHRQKLR